MCCDCGGYFYSKIANHGSIRHRSPGLPKDMPVMTWVGITASAPIASATHHSGSLLVLTVDSPGACVSAR